MSYTERLRGGVRGVPDSACKHLRDEIEFLILPKFRINISCAARLLPHKMMRMCEEGERWGGVRGCEGVRGS